MKRHIIAAMIAALALSFAAALLSCSSEQRNSQASYRQITQQEAERLMREEEGYVILDVRTVSEFTEKHIKGAVNIPNETIGSEPIVALPDADQLIMIYCRSGNRSKQASEKLVLLGYTNVVEFGGINTWTGETVSGAD